MCAVRSMSKSLFVESLPHMDISITVAVAANPGSSMSIISLYIRSPSLVFILIGYTISLLDFLPGCVWCKVQSSPSVWNQVPFTNSIFWNVVTKVNFSNLDGKKSVQRL